MRKRRWFRKWSVLVVLLSLICVGHGGSKAFAADRTQYPGSAAVEDSTNVVEGFKGNRVQPGVVGATVSGGGSLGFPNQVRANMGTIGGGGGNQAGELSTVGGGGNNVAAGFRATVGGGSQNAATRDSATIGGGYGNTAAGSYTTIGGGTFNTATEVNATVGGGSGNKAEERHSTVGGGSVNIAAGFAGTVAGGVSNNAVSTYSTVGGGIANSAREIGATVSGGAGNVASGEYATVSGGMTNRVTALYGTVAGGRGNVTGRNSSPSNVAYATIGGGTENRAEGSYSVVPGGSSNIAAGDHSFAAGHRAIIDTNHQGAFLYADSREADFHSLEANEFAVRAMGGFRFVTATDPSGNPMAGVRLTAGSGSWESLSDRSAKTNLAPANGQEILGKLIQLPMMTWSYKTQSPNVRHIGPIAQDFHAIFSLGEDGPYLSDVDVNGVALAAIQGLYEALAEKGVQVEVQQQRIRLLEEEMAFLRNELARLGEKVASIGVGTRSQSNSGR